LDVTEGGEALAATGEGALEVGTGRFGWLAPASVVLAGRGSFFADAGRTGGADCCNAGGGLLSVGGAIAAGGGAAATAFATLSVKCGIAGPLASEDNFVNSV
jgi:hypothetical protein